MLFLEGPDKFRFEIVGESYHQESLELLVGGRLKEGVKKFADAVVVCERDNPHDPLAVRVDVGSYAVGHFDREKARVYRRWLRGVGIAEEPCRCRAVIVGGWDRGGNRGSFGVKLDMPSIWKPKKSSPVGESSETEFDFAEEQETTFRAKPKRKSRLAFYAGVGCATLLLLCFLPGLIIAILKKLASSVTTQISVPKTKSSR